MAASITPTEPSASTLSEYEQARAKNIERNNARLRSLGLISILEERRSNDMAWGRQYHGNGENGGSSCDDGDSSSDGEYVDGANTPKSKRRKKRLRSKFTSKEGSRKSRRLMNLTSQHDPGDSSGHGGETSTQYATEEKHRSQLEREALVAECREVRLRVANELANAGVAEAKGNPTASYEHCLMRVRSMSEKSLANRVSISRSCSMIIMPNTSTDYVYILLLNVSSLLFHIIFLPDSSH
jgi:hypothetical protein